MAILPVENIDTDMIGQAIGVDSDDVGTLCEHSNVNPYARFRPGYWYLGSGEATFVRPTGDGVDARGVRPYGPMDGFNSYYEDDFRLYNHAALKPYVSGSHVLEVELPSSAGSGSVSQPVSINLGEVDWKGTEVNFWGKNVIGPGLTHLCMVNTGTNRIEGFAEIPETVLGEQRRVTINVSAASPDYSGQSTSTTYQAYLGNEVRHYCKFLDVRYQINIFKLSPPRYTVGVLQSYWPTVGNNAGISGVDDVSCQAENDGNFLLGSTKITLSGLKIGISWRNVKGDGSGWISSPRLNVSYKIEKYNRSNVLVNTSDFFQDTWSIQQGYTYNGTIQLGERAEDGFRYKVIITRLSPVMVSEIK